MSSSLFLHRPTSFDSSSAHRGALQPSSQKPDAAQARRAYYSGASSGSGRSENHHEGLLTPPSPFPDMTGIRLNLPPSSSQGYSFPHQPYQDVSTMPAVHNGYSSMDNANTEPVQARTSREPSFESKKGGSSDAIASYLQIPSSINDSKGSLAEFAAQITCLFWFESASKLQQIEDTSVPLHVVQALVPDAMPEMGFRKWVTTILSTTQVTQNVILLALLFIYRLKKFNPGVSGKRGSEFRLLTIALMLGNKFLDDNTYTNKTWSEVSGISVQEIHIMEVEFLSNMRYNLFVSEADWKKWHVKLGRFWVYFDKASRTSPVEQPRRFVGALTPSSQLDSHKLPSPPLSVNNSAQHPPHQVSQGSWNHPLPVPSYIPHSPVRPGYQVPDLSYIPPSRKRSLEYDPSEEYQPLKRMAASNTPSAASSMSLTPGSGSLPEFTPGSSVTSSRTMTPLNRIPRLPMPNVQANVPQMPHNIPAQMAQLPLPTGRAMSTVYPNGNAYSQASTPAPASSGPALNIYTNMLPSLGNTSRHQSPYPASSATVSPIAPTGPMLTPQRLSPSHFLINRNSPYRPVRAVNTLLYPPPSASMQNPARTLNYEQMHYQPLSKATTERRAGVVPYLNHEGWPQPHGLQPMPQPLFHH